MHQLKRWEEFLPLFEFTYNNEYQESLNISPFEALYDRKFNTAISWDDRVNKVVLGPNMMREMVQEVINIKQKLKSSQDRQKGYANRQECTNNCKWERIYISTSYEGRAH